MAYKNFTEMPVWKKLYELAILIYDITKNYPSEEKFGLISDMRRAACSVSNNIAEGFGRFETLETSTIKIKKD